MSPLATIEVEGHPFRAPQVVLDHLRIEPGSKVGAERFDDLKRSCTAYNTALLIMDRAHRALFPDPCGAPHYAPDPHCPECQGKGRKHVPMFPDPCGASHAHRVENCRTCIQPYPRRPQPRIGR